MGIRSLLSQPVAAYIVDKQKKWMRDGHTAQQSVFNHLIEKAKNTLFGRDHHFDKIKSYHDFKKQVPIRDYEGLKSYMDRLKKGEKDILWPGKPAYFAKTSGTTSGVKYIPVTKDSISNHINGAKNTLLNYVSRTGNSRFLDKKMMFLSGSPVLTDTSGVPTGRLSGLVNHHIPKYLRSNQLPTYETNCIDDWETKLDKIVQETLKQKMSLISGIPPWVQMYFDRLREASGGKTIKEIFPDFNLMVYGGVNFEPYRQKMFESIGGPVDTVELFPASEGFFAFQDTNQTADGMLLLLDSGIFYEFVPADQYGTENPPRLSISDIELGKNYALIINSNAGLWGYSIGDTVEFVSRNPYRLKVTGRIKHFTSAFGEHVIGSEVEKALQYALQYHPEVAVTELTVAPQINPTDAGDLPYHEWFIEFEKRPANMPAFERRLDEAMCQLNIYYDDLIKGAILQPLQITALPSGAFRDYMKSQGRLGGQNKVPRLSNDRLIADALTA